MSLILEALRRSEAERRRGQTPDVLAPVEVARPPAAPGLSRTGTWGLVAASGALVAGLAWWQLAATPGAPRTGGPASAPPAAVVDEAALPTPAVTSPRRDVAPPPQGRPASTSQPVPPPAPAAVATAAEAQPAAAPDAPAPARTTATTLEVIAPSSPSPGPTPELAPPAPVTAIAAPAPSSEFVSPEATVRLSELSLEERKLLPALKVSMHMWAPQAAHRFVIIDGTRLAEGDRVADATVSAILADGVTLSWRGRQIRLPIH